MHPVSGSDSQSRRSLYQTWFRPVHRWIRALGGPGIDAEDLTQEVFIVVQRKLGRFDGSNRAMSFSTSTVHGTTQSSRTMPRPPRASSAGQSLATAPADVDDARTSSTARHLARRPRHPTALLRKISATQKIRITRQSR